MAERGRRTPLFGLYAKYGGKTVNFNGWEMPVQFSGILAEHAAVRERAGLFDVSHMGEIEIAGAGAAAALERIAANEVGGLPVGRALYTPLCRENGGTVDDALIYRLEEDRFLAVVNAGNIEKDLAWFRARAGGAKIADRSEDTALLALQGPRAERILQPVCDAGLHSLPHYAFAGAARVAGLPCLISRTGYTGEDGFELFAAAADGAPLFEALLQAGAAHGIAPAGLGARDTLRLEARLPLYGHELREDITPLEAGLAAFVKFDKGDFCGRVALLRQREEGVRRRLAGFELLARGVARAGCGVYAGGRRIGAVTSGSVGPTVGGSIGLALLEREWTAEGARVEIDIRGRLCPAGIVRTPFYKRPRRS